MIANDYLKLHIYFLDLNLSYKIGHLRQFYFLDMYKVELKINSAPIL